jgi:hypothetical protein
VAEDAEDQPADDVDEQDQQAGDRIALHELRRAVHRAVEIGFGADLDAARLRLFGGEQPGVQIGVDRHLLARQRVEREARGDFGYAARALGDDDQVDDHQHDKDEQADDIIAADQHLAERLDHMSCRRRALMPVDEHHARRRDIEREAEQCREQEHGGKGREIKRFRGLQRNHQDQQTDHDVRDEADVEDQRRNRDHHQRDKDQHRRRQRRYPGNAADVAKVETRGHAAPPDSAASRR